MAVIILFSMIFLHIVDDFYLQGILAKFKQRSFWEENYPDELYKYDWIVSLILHSFSWAFMIHIPVMTFYLILHLASSDKFMVALAVSVLLNVTIHAICDHCKANRKTISLIEDQATHIVQVLAVFFYFIFHIMQK